MSTQMIKLMKLTDEDIKAMTVMKFNVLGKVNEKKNKR
jgi:hypothetical protein